MPYRISTPTGDRNGVLAGRLRHEAVRRSTSLLSATMSAVRDAVSDGPLVIEAVLPRKTILIRRAAGERPDDQIIAANIDVVSSSSVSITTSTSAASNVISRRSGTAARRRSCCWNKSDLCGEVERLEELRGVALGVEAHVLSALNGRRPRRGHRT
jgi:ribosome biogenesis GTPase